MNECCEQSILINLLIFRHPCQKICKEVHHRDVILVSSLERRRIYAGFVAILKSAEDVRARGIEPLQNLRVRVRILKNAGACSPEPVAKNSSSLLVAGNKCCL